VQYRANVGSGLVDTQVESELHRRFTLTLHQSLIEIYDHHAGSMVQIAEGHARPGRLDAHVVRTRNPNADVRAAAGRPASRRDQKHDSTDLSLQVLVQIADPLIYSPTAVIFALISQLRMQVKTHVPFAKLEREFSVKETALVEARSGFDDIAAGLESPDTEFSDGLGCFYRVVPSFLGTNN